MRIPAKWRVSLAALAALVLMSIGFTAAPATANTLATPSFGVANSISYADSDFEGTIGDWVNVANATLSDDTATAFLHDDSLEAVAGSTSAMQFKLGGAQQINVSQGDTYRVGAYFLAPALSGRTITWAMGFYNSSNHFLSWVPAAPVSLAGSGAWQYVTSNITAPAGATYMLGSPEVTENGQAAGEALHMDEVQVAPLRPALVLGANGNSGSASDWETANNTTTGIGPLQEAKIFYSATGTTGPGSLPSTYSGSTCDTISQSVPGVICVIAYNTQVDTNLDNYISQIPSTQAVVFVYHQEPENGDYEHDGGGPEFVNEFEAQADNIRMNAGDAPNIFVAEDSSGSGYAASGLGTEGCEVPGDSYIVPASYTDFYLIDHYEYAPNGNSDPTGGNSADWNTWLNCVTTGTPDTLGTAPKPVGVAEFGYGVYSPPPSGCFSSQPESTRNATMGQDGSYLAGLPSSIGAPVDFWDYWWQDDTNVGPCHDWNFPTSSSTASTWKAFETENGGGAN